MPTVLRFDGFSVVIIRPTIFRRMCTFLVEAMKRCSI